MTSVTDNPHNTAEPPPATDEARRVAENQAQRYRVERRLAGSPAQAAPLSAPARSFQTQSMIESAGAGLVSLGYCAIFLAGLISIHSTQPSSLVPTLRRLEPGIWAVGMLLLLSGSWLCRRLSPPLTPHPEQRQLRAWHRGLQLPIEPRPWHHDQSAQLESLMEWLDHVPGMRGFDNAQIRHTLLSSVREILARIDTGDAEREAIFYLAEQSRGAPDHLWAQLGIAQLLLQDLAAREGQLTTRRIFEIGRSAFRLNHLERFVISNQEALIDSMGGNVSIDETMMAIHDSLQTTLGLPINTATGSRPRADIGATFERIGQLVLRKEHHPPPEVALRIFETQCERLTENPPPPLPPMQKNRLARFIATQYDTWVSHIDETLGPDIVAFKATVMDYLNRLDGLPHHTRPFNEQDYLVATQEAMFLHNHGVAYQAALLQMMADDPTTLV